MLIATGIGLVVILVLAVVGERWATNFAGDGGSER